MDFPLINEINENTNAAKKEILEAMPAAGATSAEVTAAKEEILAAMPSGGETAQTKKFTNTAIGTVSSSYVTITGCGRILFSTHNSSVSVLYISIDGKAELDLTSYSLQSDAFCGPLEFFFEKSVKFKSDTTNRCDYMVQT